MSAALSAQPVAGSLELMTGAQRAAALLMLLGEEDGKAIWSELTDAEIKQVCLAMADLGPVKGDTVAEIAESFVADLAGPGAVLGSLAEAQALLARVVPEGRATAIMTEMKGSPNRQVWRRLGEVPADALAGFLRDEYPQTIAVILSQLNSELGGRVLALLPEPTAVEVIDRTLRLGDVRPDALAHIEDMIERELLSRGPGKPRRDLYEVMAERFDAFDRPTEARVLAALEEADRDSAQRIREKMLTFEDLLKLDAAGIQTLMRGIDKDVLGRALKGATEAVRAFFLANMSTRAAKNLQEEMETLGPIRMKDVDEAQSRIVQVTKALAKAGEIRIPKSRADEDLVG